MTANQTHAEFLNARTGFIVVCAIVFFIALWLGTMGRSALRTQPTLIPALLKTPDLKRFRADAFFLPDEPLLGFVEIPAGAFSMGSDPEVDRNAYQNERWSAQRYQGSVELPTYYVARFETTVAQFRAFVEATNHHVDAAALAGEATHPVTHIAWTDALAYARWLTEALQTSSVTPAPLKTLLREGWRVALPNEAQWEKAARNGDARIFPWGNSLLADRAHFNASAPRAVGATRCAECAFGLLDMSGNVWELTTSPLRNYPFDEKTPLDIDGEALFVMRGGSYMDQANVMRSAVRGGVDPGARRPFIGFRVVLTR